MSRLSDNERLAVYGAAAAIIGAILATIGFYGAGALWLTLLLGIAMIVIVFLPQWSSGSTLPGSKGSLMLIVGAIAGIGAVLSLLTFLQLLGAFGAAPVWFIGVLVGAVGGLLMAWAGWQEFQAEGGKFQLGSSPGAAGGTRTDAGRPVDATGAPHTSSPGTTAPPPARDPGAFSDPSPTATDADATDDRPRGA